MMSSMANWLDRALHGIRWRLDHLDPRRRLRQSRVWSDSQKTYSQLTIAETFDRIYADGIWGGGTAEIHSGPGSRGELMQAYCSLLRGEIEKRKILTLVDLGCGDFQVGSLLAGMVNEYTGVDVASDVIARNSRQFGSEPEPSNFAILAQNVRRLSPRCRALQAAIWSHPCPLRVHNADERFHNIFQMQPCEDMPGAIQGLDMPSILEKSGFDSVDLLKVDVEGAEVQLFQGDLSWMPRVRAFAVEFHGDSREVSRFDMLMQGRRVIQANPHTIIALA